MNQKEFNRAISQIKPDEGMEERIYQGIMEQPNIKHKRSVVKPVVAAIMAVAAVAAFVIFGGELLRGQGTPAAQNQSVQEVTIPPVELAQNGGTTAKMLPLVVYKGKVYLASNTTIDSSQAKAFLGDKLGRSKNGIDEWSKQADYAIEFASTIGEADIYSVKGYDVDFRIMSYETLDGVPYAAFYDCLNGITVKSGADVLGEFKIAGNISKASYELYSSWNEGKADIKDLTNIDTLEAFAQALNDTVPYKSDEKPELWDTADGSNQKFLYLTLKDGCQVQLRLFRQEDGGYISCSAADLVFQMDLKTFDTVWDSMK